MTGAERSHRFPAPAGARPVLSPGHAPGLSLPRRLAPDSASTHCPGGRCVSSDPPVSWQCSGRAVPHQDARSWGLRERPTEPRTATQCVALMEAPQAPEVLKGPRVLNRRDSDQRVTHGGGEETPPRTAWSVQGPALSGGRTPRQLSTGVQARKGFLRVGVPEGETMASPRQSVCGGVWAQVLREKGGPSARGRGAYESAPTKWCSGTDLGWDVSGAHDEA